jgi:hypothetical protein
MTEQTSRQLLTTISRWDRRQRLTQLTLWIPRGVSAGLAIGLVVALVSRLRPWLLPQQVAVVAAVAALVGGVLAAALVLTWPRPTIQAARYFDRLFGLKERSSTALELANGTIKAPGRLADLQLHDALANAAQVNIRRYLRFRWDRRDLGLIAVLAVVLTLALLLVNPQTNVLAQQVATQATVLEQIQKLQQVQKAIQENNNLTEAEKTQLNAIIDDTIRLLQQPGISKPEAVAALSRASQQLNDVKMQLTPQQKAAMQQAGRSLNQSPTTQSVGQAFQASDLSRAASELQSLAQKVGNGQLTQQQMQDAADSLSQAAQNLQDVNPEAAQALQNAADALRAGDAAGAQQALQQAAKSLNAQQQQMNQSPISQAAQAASQQIAQAQQQVAQAGQPGQPVGRMGQQNPQVQTGAQNPRGQGQPGPGQPGSQDPSGHAQQYQTAQDGQAQGQQPGSDQQNGNNQPGQTAGGQGDQTGIGQGKPGGDNTAGGNDSSNTVPGGQVPSFNGSGYGSQDAGENVTSGEPGKPGPINPNLSHGSGQAVPYESVYAPSFVGGSGGTAVNPQGSNNSTGNAPPAALGDQVNPVSGQSLQPIGNVVGLAAAQADQAMDADHIPGPLRGVIRDYFTGLQSQ